MNKEIRKKVYQLICELCVCYIDTGDERYIRLIDALHDSVEKLFYKKKE